MAYVSWETALVTCFVAVIEYLTETTSMSVSQRVSVHQGEEGIDCDSNSFNIVLNRKQKAWAESKIA